MCSFMNKSLNKSKRKSIHPQIGNTVKKHIAMKFKEAPNAASVNLLERLASWSYTMVEEIISLRMR